ncbi:MAG TPA: 2-polyprenylphenol 6-hydroxylase [Alphaproteobacteria bacterium]|nr:2-polyprenylphenol 6-hydroxylase [Alphaproteobacteria bacterium]
MGIAAYFRLARAGWVLAREGAFAIIDVDALPPVFRFGVRLGRLIEKGEVKRTGRVERLTRALNRLGPTYVKFGQTLATRPDIVGAAFAADLAVLQDKMEPFDQKLVPQLLREALGPRAEELTELSPPIAAASIAQVHKAVLLAPNGTRRTVAVKILRPGIKRRFRRDLESYYAGARLAERFVRDIRRLRPTDVVRTLDRSSRLELDLRLEAAAISEFAGNTEKDEGFRVPRVSWDHTAETVLTTDWIEAIPIRDFAALEAAGLDRKDLARKLLQSFLRHAIRDGYFHADMHPGNLFADPRTGDIIAVDFGIMGRINRKERRFLADIVWGFITRNYKGMAERHFEAGYVPAHQSVDDFALALRSIGEPMQGRKATDIPMSRVFGQLFTTTELFDMQTRPELVLLQKSMVIVEGVARALDPELDVWTISEPVVGDWVRREAGPLGRLEDLADRLRTAADAVGKLPAIIDKAGKALDDYEAERLSSRRRNGRMMLVAAFWLLVVLALLLIWRLLG